MEKNVEHAKFVSESAMRDFVSRLSVDVLQMGDAVKRVWDRHGFSADPYFRLYYVSKGRTELRFSDSSFVLDAEAFYIIPANLRFEYVPQGFLHHLWIHFRAPSLELLPHFQKPQRLPVSSFPEGKTLMRELYAIVDDMEGNKVLFRKDSLMRSLLAPFFDAMPDYSSALSRETMNAFSQVAGYIDANLDKEIAMPALASLLKMRRCDFSATFRKIFGMPPKQYIIMRRLDRAKELLVRERQLSVKEVAAKVGYGNEFFFYRIFKSHLKITPAELRRRGV